ncbi:hypothetical protein [Actinocrispum sp. NPDC049592]|uniref:hypothetical protein n=1 Tax=Actinocrispum sp. NPDC049592 TaxID=3154835 RepID=UPI003433B8BE
MDHAQTPGGLGITVGYADALTRWRTNAEHREAQKRGRAEWYQNYTLHVAKVERSHGFTRAWIPASGLLPPHRPHDPTAVIGGCRAPDRRDVG